jgi:hypothetical protein
MDLQRQLRKKVRESKTEGMLARDPSNFQIETHSGRELSQGSDLL